MSPSDLSRIASASEVSGYRTEVRQWIEVHADDLAASARDPDSAEQTLAVGAALMRLVYDHEYGRNGWPTDFGGLGGPTVLRMVLYDELEAAGYRVPMQYEMLETLAPAIIHYAPALATEVLPDALSGAVSWAQGFSEPEAGSDLASLQTRADRHDDAYVVNGGKIWSSQSIGAGRMATVVRTGDRDSRHRGLTMLMIDLDTPGVKVNPIRFSNGHNEFAQVFFDRVEVPASRLIGDEGQGWAVAMFLLQYERGNYAWIRQARIARMLGELSRTVDPDDDVATAEVGATWLAQQALRIRCGHTLQRLDAGVQLGPEISVDKVLLGTAEHRIGDATLALQREAFVFADSDDARAWRSDWFYGRSATIYGGAAEVQRTIIADRVLRLPKVD